MPELDPLAFAITFALAHKTDGATRKFIRSLSDADLDRLGEVVAQHVRMSGWRHEPNR